MSIAVRNKLEGKTATCRHCERKIVYKKRPDSVERRYSYGGAYWVDAVPVKLNLETIEERMREYYNPEWNQRCDTEDLMQGSQHSPIEYCWSMQTTGDECTTKPTKDPDTGAVACGRHMKNEITEAKRKQYYQQSNLLGEWQAEAAYRAIKILKAKGLQSIQEIDNDLESAYRYRVSVKVQELICLVETYETALSIWQSPELHAYPFKEEEELAGNS